MFVSFVFNFLSLYHTLPSSVLLHLRVPLGVATGILSLLAPLIDRVFSEKRYDRVWQQFEEKVAEEHRAANSDGQEVLLPGLAGGVQREERSRVLND